MFHKVVQDTETKNTHVSVSSMMVKVMFVFYKHRATSKPARERHVASTVSEWG